MTPSSVNGVLESYAARGVFRSYSSERGRFRFHWLWNLPFEATLDAGTLTFRRVLTGVAPGSPIDSGLRGFVEECCSSERPEHRRVDPRQVRVRYANRKGTVSLSFRMLAGDPDDAVRRAVNLVNEVFVGYLSAEHPDYLAAQFRVGDE
jgi:hypothetical protein